MALQEKYQPVIDMINQSGGRNVTVSEEGGVLKVIATVTGPAEKNNVWNKIKEIGGDNPSDIAADITMDNPEVAAGPTAGGEKSVGGRSYTVKSGDTLSGISKEMYGDAGRYMEIAKANNISNPDHINVGQELIIP